MMRNPFIRSNKFLIIGIIFGVVWGIISEVYLFSDFRALIYLLRGENIVVSWLSLLAKVHMFPAIFSLLLGVLIDFLMHSIGYTGYLLNPVLGISLTVLIYLGFPVLIGSFIGGLLGFFVSRKNKRLRVFGGLVVLLIVSSWVWLVVTYGLCQGRGGLWYGSALPGEPLCELPSSDEGKVCHSTTDCEKTCAAANDAANSSTCTRYTINMARAWTECSFDKNGELRCTTY
jgi:hypothetical protein